jgi:DnaJ domain
MVNHYDVLGVSQESGLEEIKQAYHRLAMEYHPDKNPSPWAAEKMKQINEAYRILGEPALRSDYDRRTFASTGDNIYNRWYGKRHDFGKSAEWNDPGSGFATNGYEAPRRTVVHESVTFFSFEHLLAGAIVGLAFGIAITAAFVFFGMDAGEERYGLAVMVLFAAFSAFLPPFVSVFLLRKELNARSEASVCGSITLTFALPVAVLAGSYVTAAGDQFMTCCLLPFVCIIAGWLIGGFVGRASWDIFR